MLGIKYFFSHSIFVAICAAALCIQTCQIVNSYIDVWILFFVFSSVISSYNLYSLLGMVIPQPVVLKKIITDFPFRVFLIIGGAIVVAAILYLKPYLLTYFSLASVLTALYFIPLFSFKNKGIMKTILLPLVWTIVTVLVPLIHSQATFFPLFILFALRFIFLLMIAVIFDVRDRQRDQLSHRKSMATLFNNQLLVLVMMGLLLGYGVVLIIGKAVIYNPQHFFIMGLTGCLTFVVFLISLRPRGYYFYYFLADGLMLFSSIATFMVTI